MKKNSFRFEADYNGEPIRPGTVMVPFAYNSVDAENCSNPACIRYVGVGHGIIRTRVIYKAVPEDWAGTARSALTLVQNEALGHYSRKNTGSLDALQESCRSVPDRQGNAEDLVIAAENREETIGHFLTLMRALIEKSPKLGCAVLLTQRGIVGEAFYHRMRLSRSAANPILQQAKQILRTGLVHLDLGTLRLYRSRNDAYYRREAAQLLQELVEELQ